MISFFSPFFSYTLKLEQGLSGRLDGICGGCSHRSCSLHFSFLLILIWKPQQTRILKTGIREKSKENSEVN
jgi:hypothetical protein